MARLSRRGERAVSELVARYDLHTEMALPIPIRQVTRDEGWIVRFSEQMAQLYGIAIIIDDVQVMQINARITSSYQRMAMAHEIGHVLNGDEGQIHLCAATGRGFRDWLWSRQERQASLAAARILIPHWVRAEIETIDEIAVVCEVPRELVELLFETER